jgi:hypothetical protein
MASFTCGRIAVRRALCGLVVAASIGSLRAQALEQQEIVSQFGGSGSLGTGLSVDGDVLVAGAPDEGSSGTAGAGAALVYRRDPSSGDWLFEQTLYASDPEAYAGFGWSVAIEGDVIVVGAPEKDENATGEAGAVYVFRFDSAAGTWSEEQKLVAAAAANFDQVGTAVALSGDRIVAGAAYRDIDIGLYAGSAFLFRYQDPTVKWVEETELIDPDGAMDDNAGTCVAIAGTTVLVGSPFSSENGVAGAGSVGVWMESGGSWSQTQELVASTGSDGYLGFSLAFRDGRILAGAPFEDSSSTIFRSGAAYLFEWDGSAFLEVHRFEAPAPASDTHFGYGTALSGDLVALGAPYGNAFGLHDSGSTWLFRRRNANRPWVADQELGASGAGADELLGRHVVIGDEEVFCAAPDADTSNGVNSGGVYVYDAAEITLTIAPGDPAPGAPIDLEVHRGDVGDPFLIVVEDAGGTPLFFPVIFDTFGADHSQSYVVSAPNPALGLQVGLRAYKASPTGPLVVSDWSWVDV